MISVKKLVVLENYFGLQQLHSYLLCNLLKDNNWLTIGDILFHRTNNVIREIHPLKFSLDSLIAMLIKPINFLVQNIKIHTQFDFRKSPIIKTVLKLSIYTVTMNNNFIQKAFPNLIDLYVDGLGD